MEVVEVVLLVLVYTVLTLALFLEIVCYKKNLESIETIAFTSSLLLLIISLTITYFLELGHPTEGIHVFTLLAMCLIGYTTPLNVIHERKHALPPWFSQGILVITCVLGALVVIGHFAGTLELLQYPVVIFLGLSVVFSMILIRTTKPQVRIAHREKQEQYIALAFLIFIPIALFLDFAMPAQSIAIKTGFTVPVLFLIMGISKLWDDIQRLALFRDKQAVNEQSLNNYALTNREKEVAALLVEGSSYKQIAEQLFISIPTVKTHASNVYKKCKVSNRMELMGLLRANR
ncbi:MAG: helix-turn-helix transcriptional regulator [Rhodothermaceae bacterium]|nr:helix-turn-helix transcriptional regulator [Rhodothermaceae bacterium]